MPGEIVFRYFVCRTPGFMKEQDYGTEKDLIILSIASVNADGVITM